VLPEIGNGLEKFGLFSMRERLELRGGLLEVISSLGKGTAVTMKLPLVEADLEKAMMASAKPESMPLLVGQTIRDGTGRRSPDDAPRPAVGSRR
jgi:hypothetical protein